MTPVEAHQLLDKAKEGQPVPPEVIAAALAVTGDAACRLNVPCPDIQAFVQAMREGGVL